MQTAVKQSFSRYCKSYEYKATVQKQVAQQFSQYKNFLQGKGLDLGCGTGFLSKVLEDKDITGVDISLSMVKEYKKLGNKVVNADIQALPFKRESFDFAVSSFALHWTNVALSFKEIKRVLKKGSPFIFAVPVEPSLKEFFQIAGKNFLFPAEDFIKSSLEDTGFFVKESYLKTFPINFENGKDALMFFKLTGTAVNKTAKNLKDLMKNYKKLISYKEPIETSFIMQFVYAVSL